MTDKTINIENISSFLDSEYSDSALYISYRAIPSYIDGLKNSHRKIVYTIKKKNLKDELKVYQLASQVANESNYIHGDVSLQGAIVTLAQAYTGANNYPVIKGEGNFGTRFMNEASAARYISAHPQPYFNDIFKKEDDINLIKQIFEGDEIEPRFYVPSLPLVLINGSLGIGVGFATKILPRSKKNMEKAIKCRLENKRIPTSYFEPSWNGFEGEVIKLADNKWDIRGRMERNKRHILITEIPIPYSLKDYINILKKLKEKDIVERFTDLSEDDHFKFDVTITIPESKKTDEEIFTDLKLSNVFTESFTCIDENNAIKEFNSAKEIFDAYFNIKIEYLNKRIQSEIDRLSKEADSLNEIYKFIMEVIKGTINIKKTKKEVSECMEKKGYKNIEKLLAMPLYSITKDKAEEAKVKWENKVEELEKMKLETPKTQWSSDLSNI